MVFSKNNVNMADLTYRILLKLMVVTLSNEYTDTITYLDTSIVSKKGTAFFSSNDLTIFYRASNSILRANNIPSEELLVQLLYSCCIPILSYASVIRDHPSREMQNCCTAINDALRFVFGHIRWKSLRKKVVNLGLIYF